MLSVIFRPVSFGPLAELADAYALGAYGVTLESSTLSWPTKNSLVAQL